MHSHNGKNNSSMLWMMIPCILLLGVVVIGGGKSSSGYLWPILIGVMVFAHIVMMLKGRKGHEQNDSDKQDKKVQIENKKNESMENIICFVSGRGFSTYNVVPIEIFGIRVFSSKKRTRRKTAMPPRDAFLWQCRCQEE